jgi:GH24 family phage-related lysozyme (muramidase)
MCRAADGAPLAVGSPSETALLRQLPSNLAMSEKGLNLLREVETLHLKPYDDQSGNDISSWVAGATIGYGHLIPKDKWDTYKGGITETDAKSLFDADLKPFVELVQKVITANLAQQEFDALVILAFNIGPTLAGSSVVKLVNDPGATTTYASLEAAWKAWNKSQGKVMKGLDNRRQCEWNIYTKGVYERW